MPAGQTLGCGTAIISQFGSREWNRQNRLVVRPIHAMNLQSTLFDCAAICEWLMDLSSDPGKKETFRQLRDKWIALANASPSMSARELTEAFISIDEAMHYAGLENKPTLH